MSMTFEKLAKIVADEFMKDVKEGEFENFKDMADCYWWGTADIKTEVDYIIHAADDSAWIDEENDVNLNGECISYRKFSRMFYKLMK